MKKGSNPTAKKLVNSKKTRFWVTVVDDRNDKSFSTSFGAGRHMWDNKTASLFPAHIYNMLDYFQEIGEKIVYVSACGKLTVSARVEELFYY